MKKLNTRGFGAIEGLLIIVIVGIVGFIGWYVYDANKKSDSMSSVSSVAPVAKTTEKQSSSAAKLEKDYKDELANFSVKYPADWMLESRADKAGTHSDAAVTSPSGTVLYLASSPAGRGGGNCSWDSGDMPFDAGNKCQSWEILSAEKVDIGNVRRNQLKPDGIDKNVSEEVYSEIEIQTAHWSDGKQDRYLIGLGEKCTDDSCSRVGVPSMGTFRDSFAFWSNGEEAGTGTYIYAYASGSKEDFLKSDDVAIIKDILRSMRVNE